jgi:hypothetical protein
MNYDVPVRHDGDTDATLDRTFTRHGIRFRPSAEDSALFFKP